MRFTFNIEFIKRKLAISNWIMIIKIIYNKHQLRSVFLIEINVFDNNIHYIEKCLIESFDDFVLFEILKNNRFSKYILICAMIIEVIIFVFFIIVDAKTTNFEIVSLISNLITFENKKSFIFIFNDFHFRAFISIIKENDEVFVIMIITRYNEIVNIEINQV